MRALLAFLLAISPAFAGSQAVTSKHKSTVPATADLLNETFNTNPGYDDGTGVGAWDVQTANGGVDDPDETVQCPVGTGFGSQCMETTCGAANRKAFIVNNLGSAPAVGYTTLYFSIHNMTAWADNDDQVLAVGYPTAYSGSPPSAGSAAWGVSLIYDADGLRAPSPACSGACWRIETKCGGVSEAAQYLEVAADTIYRVRVQHGKGVGVCQIFVGATQTVTNGDNNGGGVGVDYQYLWLGQPKNSIAATTILMDGVTVSSTGYVP